MLNLVVFCFFLPFILMIAFVLAGIGIMIFNDIRKARLKSMPACCRRCGYNLTGNVSGVCPECGERI